MPNKGKRIAISVAAYVLFAIIIVRAVLGLEGSRPYNPDGRNFWLPDYYCVQEEMKDHDISKELGLCHSYWIRGVRYDPIYAVLVLNPLDPPVLDISPDSNSTVYVVGLYAPLVVNAFMLVFVGLLGWWFFAALTKRAQ